MCSDWLHEGKVLSSRGVAENSALRQFPATTSAQITLIVCWDLGRTNSLTSAGHGDGLAYI